MQAPLLLLVLAAGVQALSPNGTLEEVVVSSQPLRVAAAIGYPAHDAVVKPMPRRARREEMGIGEETQKGNDLQKKEKDIDEENGVKRDKERAVREGTVSTAEGRSSDKETGRGHMKKMKKTLKKMMPYLLVPGMMALGYAPFILASLKMFVMNAVMINMMAFNAAIFITLRNMVFGPRVGQHVKYYNFGYSHRKKHHHP